jgi:histidine ammonia-lyase
MSRASIELSGRALTIDAVDLVARQGASAVLAPAAAERVAACAAMLDRMIAAGSPIYGVTTGFGALDDRSVSLAENRAQQHNLLKSHSAGIGAPMLADAVRAMMVVRANVLASGATGVRLPTLQALLTMIERNVVPQVPEAGSVGACGDLAPLAHMALPLIGAGWASFGGAVLPGAEAMARAGIPLPDLSGRDGIALINGTEQTTGIGALAVADSRRLLAAAEIAACLTMEAVGGLADSFDERVALAKPHPGQLAVSARLGALTRGSRAVLPPRPSRLRDALSLRCIPQVLGAVHDAVGEAARALEIEINAVNDNPIFGLADGWVTSNSGNFHGQRAGEVLDALATSLSSVGVMAERRCARLIDQNHNGGLPAFLIHPQAPQGLNSGFMIAQYTAASLVAELRTRSVPASLQSVPTCANTEDHVPMSPLAARRCRWTAETVEWIVAIELLLAAQALDLRGLAPAPALEPSYRAIREQVRMMVEDRVLADDIACIHRLLRAGAFT